MTTMRDGFVRCLDPHGFHFMRHVEWGDPANKRVLICVHGLTRTGRDFDYVAQELADAYRVVCPDIVGRGRSDWLRDPADYNYPVYLTDLVTLIASLQVETVDWLGTSMGGILGMMLASMPGSPVRKLVLNDVGSMIPKAALARLGQYVGNDPPYDSFEALEAAMRSVSPFGELTDEQWHHLAVHVAKQDAQGKWRFRYDPGIGRNFHAAAPFNDVDLRAYWNGVHGPALVIRGENSDLLLAETLEEMRRRPHTETLTVPRTGHAPMLMDDSQAGVIRRFLLG
jgi:pimeloyl-ACP methyl ester carboxylesterase